MQESLAGQSAGIGKDRFFCFRLLSVGRFWLPREGSGQFFGFVFVF